MGENHQKSNTLDPPPKPPDLTTPSGGKSSPTTSNCSPITPTSDSTHSSIDLSWKSRGTNPNAVETPTFVQNFEMRPPPMNSEGPKTPGVVSPASDLPGIESTNPDEPKTDISIPPNLELNNLHALDSHITHHLENLRQKNEPNRRSDALATSDSANAQFAEKLSIPDATVVSSENAPDRVDQHKIPLQTGKFHKFRTSNFFGRKMEHPAAGRRTSGGPPATFDQNIRPVNSSSFPPSVFPHEAQTVLNQGRKTYATAVSGRPGLSQAERSARKSFASVLQATDDSSHVGFTSKEPFIHLGEPAVDLTDSEEAILADPYKYTLVGKFPHRKPTMRKVREIFFKFGFHGCFEVGLIDTTHILIHLTHEEDYSRLFLKPSWYIDGCPMRVLKWTCDFTPEHETPIVPVWVSFPLLPVHLRAKGFLFALSRAIGIPLRIDEATSDLRRPSEARVCIEVNLGLKLPERVWIERAGNRGFWQTVMYENRPSFCFSCKHLGHSYDQCSLGTPLPPPSVVVPPLVQPHVTRDDKGKGKVTFVEPNKQWVPVSAVPSILHTTTAAVVIESASTSAVPTSTPITIDPELPPFIHSTAEPTPKAPIEVSTSPIITLIAPTPTPATEAPHEPTQISSPSLRAHTDDTQSTQGSDTGKVPHATIAHELLAKIGSERHGVKHMLIDHFKKDHGMKVGSTMRLAIEDLVIKLFGEGPSVSKNQTQTLSPSPSITAPTQDKVKEHIQKDMDGMTLADCVQNAEDDVPTVSRSISLASNTAAQSTMRSFAPATSTMRSDAPDFRPTFSAPSPRQHFSPRLASSHARDHSPTSEPDYADYYDPEMFQTRRMTRSMSMYFHPKVYPREYP